MDMQPMLPAATEQPSPWERLALASGIVFVALQIAGLVYFFTFFVPKLPPVGAPAAQFAAFYAGNRLTITTNNYLIVLTTPFLLLFVAGLFGVLRRAEGGSGVLAAAFLPLLFPEGRLPSARWRPVGWLIASTTALVILSAALSPAADAGLPEVRNPFGLRAAEGALRAAAPLVGLLMVASLLAAVAAVATRFRRARGVERQQLKWFVYATALVFVAIVVPAVLSALDLIGPSTLLSGVLQVTAVPCLPVAVGIAILRHRLWDIDVLINRSLVYGGLTACIVVIYVLVVGYLGTLFRTSDNLGISLVATGLVAVLFQPLRARLQAGVNRLLYGERDEPYAVLSRLGRRLEGTLAPEAVLPTIVETVMEALKLPYAAITLARDGGFVIVAASGTPAETPLRLPLIYQHEPVGELLLAPRAPGEAFSPADRRLLDDLARQAGIAAHALRLTVDLQRSRAQLVTAREEERRRLRRDLHDGLGPALSSVLLKVGAARRQLPPDSPADPLLAEVRDDVRAVVADVRRLSTSSASRLPSAGTPRSTAPTARQRAAAACRYRSRRPTPCRRCPPPLRSRPIASPRRRSRTSCATPERAPA